MSISYELNANGNLSNNDEFKTRELNQAYVLNDAQQSLIQTFMTHRMSDKNITLLATGREREFAEAMVAVEKSLAAEVNQALQHVVIYGPRGFGKSFMTRMIQVELNKRARNQAADKQNSQTSGKQTAFILLPEEQQNLNRNPHALLQYLTLKLKDWQTGQDSSWQSAMFQWPDKKRMTSLWKGAYEELEKQLDECFPEGDGLVIVAIENFDILLNSVFKDEAAEQLLRKWLDRRNNRIMLLATATGTVDMNYDRPLFQAFLSVRLNPWTQDNCINYFNRRRALNNQPKLSAEQEAKARAITDFIGGNPRLAQLLYTVLDSHDAMTVAETMNMLADKLSDYYRSRIDDLPQLAQGLLDALIRGGEPASSTALAKRVGARGQNDIARVVDELKKSDLIFGKQAPGSREKLFQVTDRVFVHFYRIRQGNNEAIDSPLVTILEFLKSFYTYDEMQIQAKRYLDYGRLNDAKVFTSLVRERSRARGGLNSYQYYLRQRLKDITLFEQDALPMPVNDIIDLVESKADVLYRDCKIVDNDSEVRQAACCIIQCAALVSQGLAKEAIKQLESAGNQLTSTKAIFLLIREKCLLYRFILVSQKKHKQCLEQLASIQLPEKLDVIQKYYKCILDIKNADFAEAVSIADGFLNTFDLESFQNLEPSIRYNLAVSHCMLGNYQKARRHSRLLEEKAILINDEPYYTTAVRLYASTFLFSEPEAFPIEKVEHALDIAEKLNDYLEMELLIVLILDYQNRVGEEYVCKERYLNKLLSVSLDIDNVNTKARSIIFRVVAYYNLREFKTAIELLKELTSLIKSVENNQITSNYYRFSIILGSYVADDALVDKYFDWGHFCEMECIGPIEMPWKNLFSDFIFAAIHSHQLQQAKVRALKNKKLLQMHSEAKFQLWGAQVGAFLAENIPNQSRSKTFQNIKDTLDLLITWQVVSESEYADPQWLSNLVSAFAFKCHDPDIINDLSVCLEDIDNPQASQQIALLQELIKYDSAEKPEVILARMDPDIAVWISNIRSEGSSE